MSYAANAIVLKNIVEGLGYKEIPDMKKIDENLKSHTGNEIKSYVFKPTGSSDEVNTTNNSYITTDEIILETAYFNKTQSEENANYDLFLALELAIQNNMLFKAWTTKRVFERMKNHTMYSRGILKFRWGVRACS